MATHEPIGDVLNTRWQSFHETYLCSDRSEPDWVPGVEFQAEFRRRPSLSAFLPIFASFSKCRGSARKASHHASSMRSEPAWQPPLLGNTLAEVCTCKSAHGCELLLTN